MLKKQGEQSLFAQYREHSFFSFLFQAICTTRNILIDLIQLKYVINDCETYHLTCKILMNGT